MIQFNCPHCNQLIGVSEEHAGQTGACDHCNQPVTVPLAAGAVAPEPISADPPPVPKQSNGLAIASLVLGICSFLCLSILCSIPGIITGHKALSRIRRQPSRFGGKGMAIAGLVLSYVNLALFMTAILLPALARSREAARRAACQGTMKQYGMIFKLFEEDDPEGLWPQLSSEPGRLMFSNDAHDPERPLYPEYFTDLSIMVCPSDPDRELLADPGAMTDPVLMVDDHSYLYLGYMILSDADVKAFADAYRQRLADGLPFDEDLRTSDGERVWRLCEGIERFAITDIVSMAYNPPVTQELQASFPVLIERPGSYDPATGVVRWNHIPDGGNVLYMDWHVEWKRYPDEWPMTETTIRALESLAEIGESAYAPIDRRP